MALVGDLDEQIAVGAAVLARTALALHAHALAGVGVLRQADLDRPLDLAGAAVAGAFGHGEGERDGPAAHGFLERDLPDDLVVVARGAVARGHLLVGATPREAVEEAPGRFGRRRVLLLAEVPLPARRRIGGCRRDACGRRRVAVREDLLGRIELALTRVEIGFHGLDVVAHPPLGVAQDVVGDGDLLEPLPVLRVVGDVGMEPLGEPAIGELDLVGAGRPVHAEEAVIVPLHCCDRSP